MAVSIPLVGPREDEHAGAPGGEGRAHLPVERPGLAPLAVAEAVEPQLAHDERPIAGDVLQAGEVRVESLLRLEVDVEAHEVEERQLEVFRRGIVHVGDEPARVLVLDHPIQAREVPLNPAATQPARDRRRDLVTQRVAQQGGMTRAALNLRANQRLDVRGAAAVDEISHVLLGREPDHDVQAVPRRNVEQRPGRHRVGNAHGVDAVRRHLGKVPLDLRDVVVFVALRIRLERAVGHAADGKLLVAEEEELAAHARAGSPGGHAVHPGRGQCARGGGSDVAAARAEWAAQP